MTTRIAAIDIGTNSTKITIADADAAGTLTVVHEDSEVTRLGEGVDASKRLTDDAMSRTLTAIKRFADDARAQGAVRIVGAGTSALRDASNGAEFLVRVKQEADVSVEVIAGEREAQLAYGAVQSDSELALPLDYPVLVFDIGGGSTELTLAGTDAALRHISLDMGAVRVTERFLHTDPPDDEQVRAALEFIRHAFTQFPAPEKLPIIVGIGGTAISIAAVMLKQEAGKPDSVHAAMLFRRSVDEALARFRAVPLAERRTITGLEPKRADVIIGGALILSLLLAHFGSDRFLVSARGLRYGLLAEAARTS